MCTAAYADAAEADVELARSTVDGATVVRVGPTSATPDKVMKEEESTTHRARRVGEHLPRLLGAVDVRATREQAAFVVVAPLSVGEDRGKLREVMLHSTAFIEVCERRCCAVIQYAPRFAIGGCVVAEVE